MYIRLYIYNINYYCIILWTDSECSEPTCISDSSLLYVHFGPGDCSWYWLWPQPHRSRRYGFWCLRKNVQCTNRLTCRCWNCVFFHQVFLQNSWLQIGEACVTGGFIGMNVIIQSQSVKARLNCLQAALWCLLLSVRIVCSLSCRQTCRAA